ncbi:agamous-like MADS-box protein AGL80 [Euphorbia lathyris]|uniref:agamous-like MADS-box protein AGL80 n=1 Tax=Euphorbia lathyris TaxID=212925 RepID=UPI0033133CC3
MRKKVKLAFIENDSPRKSTFNKRKKGLLKKITELTTLCDIPACAIIFSPYDSRPEVWPSAHHVQRVVSHYRMMPSGMEQTKKMVNQDIFLRQRISKANEKLMKLRHENREREITQVMFHTLTGQSLIYLNILDLTDLGWVIDQNLKEIIKKIETLTVHPHASVSNNNSHTQVISVPVEVAAAAVVKGGVGEMVVVAEPLQTVRFGGSMQRQQGFMDLINPPNQFQFGGGDAAGGGDDMSLPFSNEDQNYNL